MGPVSSKLRSHTTSQGRLSNKRMGKELIADKTISKPLKIFGWKHLLICFRALNLREHRQESSEAKMWQKGRQKCCFGQVDGRLCLPRWPNGRSRNRPRIPQFLPWLQAHTFSTAPCVCSNCCLRKHWLKRPIWIRTGFVGRQSSEFSPNLPRAPNPSVAFLSSTMC